MLARMQRWWRRLRSPKPPSALPYTVFVDDNYDYMDESRRSTLGSFATLEEAIAGAKGSVDGFLAEHCRGKSAEELYAGYVQYGEDPFIVGPETEQIDFSAWDYARQRCAELCEKPERTSR